MELLACCAAKYQCLDHLASRSLDSWPDQEIALVTKSFFLSFVAGVEPQFVTLFGRMAEGQRIVLVLEQSAEKTGIELIAIWVKGQNNGGIMPANEVSGIECQKEEEDDEGPVDDFPQSPLESSCNDDSSDSDSDSDSDEETSPVSAGIMADFGMFCQGVTSALPELPKKEPDKMTSWRSIRHRYEAYVLDDIAEASMSEEEEENTRNMPRLVGPQILSLFFEVDSFAEKSEQSMSLPFYFGRAWRSILDDGIPSVPVTTSTPCAHCNAVLTTEPGFGHRLYCPIWIEMLEDGVLGPKSREAYVKLNQQSTQQTGKYVAYAPPPMHPPAPTRKAPVVQRRRPSNPSHTISEEGTIVAVAQCELKQPRVRRVVPKASHVLSESIEWDIQIGRYNDVIERGSILPEIDAALDRQIKHAVNPARFGLLQQTDMANTKFNVPPTSTTSFDQLNMVLYFLAAVLFTCLEAFLWATYQVFLHPLSEYPGPFIAKFSDIYSGFHAFNRRLHLQTWINQQKYGSVVRQGPNKLVFNSMAALRAIYKTDKTTKAEAYMALGPGLTTYNIFSAIDNKLHRSRRQLIGQVLTERSMHVFEPTMTEQVNLFTRNILKATQSSSPVNVSMRTRQLGINIAAILAFGYDMKLQTEDENQFMLKVLDRGTWASNVAFHYPLIRRLHLGILMMLPLFHLLEKYMRLLETMINTRTALPNDAKHDLYSFVAHALDSESSGLRKSDLWSEANLFLSAGQFFYQSAHHFTDFDELMAEIAGETVNTAISATMFYLSRNQDAYGRLVDEIRTSFSRGDEINSASLAGCQYLRACIDESLRLSPPAPSILWRDIIPSKEPFVIDGHIVAPGTIVGVNTYSIHHNEFCFPNAFSFNPDRWLESSNFSEEAKRIMRDTFVPFSIGPRGCAGKAMAYLETSLTIAKTLWYFDFEIAPGQAAEVGAGKMGGQKGREFPGEFQLYDVFGAGHDGPILIFKPRGELWKEL
ncbi:Cytochrome P450 [Glarea lozoyensis ATCC 20868]|uniref:Cytochrome P450 n=1 Tax=Glarea lozoyensis (strain ATCC 20868 / MF5171) TaxID=1116229 RepID=S3CJ81_GLAL2|nr:Cytochrome P450 [Glarea lozoyensis ATCC 20868]EPE26577.1 Cytochrome P450 [Glarea lozoyensis ATCC 20868]